MSDQRKVAILGSGSWATALAKLLLNNLPEINWYIRSEETIDYFLKFRHNPKYISDIQFDIDRITFLQFHIETIECFGYSHFCHSCTVSEGIPWRIFTANLTTRSIVSAIKGIIPSENLTVAEFFNRIYNVPFKNISIISGPCHAEEIALERLSYLTIASATKEQAEELAPLFRCHHVKVKCFRRHLRN